MLQKYFDALEHAGCMPSSLFDRETVVEQSKIFEVDPAVRELQAYVLDDENTSNHHFLITAEPLAGSVFFLSHDDDSRVVFESAADFLNSARDAHAQRLSVSDFHPHLSPVAKDQAALANFIHELLRRRKCNDLIVSLVPSLDLEDLSLLQVLISDSDFFLGEAVAMEIEKRPSSALLPIAILCTDHVHPQVSSAGSRALRRIRQLL
jgi:Rad3-related DNA helicase